MNIEVYETSSHPRSNVWFHTFCCDLIIIPETIVLFLLSIIYLQDKVNSSRECLTNSIGWRNRTLYDFLFYLKRCIICPIQFACDIHFHWIIPETISQNQNWSSWPITWSTIRKDTTDLIDEENEVVFRVIITIECHLQFCLESLAKTFGNIALYCCVVFIVDIFIFRLELSSYISKPTFILCISCKFHEFVSLNIDNCSFFTTNRIEAL